MRNATSGGTKWTVLDIHLAVFNNERRFIERASLTGLDFISTLAAVLVIPAVIFSFWKISQRSEYTALRESGQKLNLNLHNLLYGFRRKKDDPLRASHIKLAKIGFLHWLLIPVGFLLVLGMTMLAILFAGDL